MTKKPGVSPYFRQEVDLSTCEAEPIHLCGAVQSSGALIVVSLGDYSVQAASQNLSEFLAVEASEALGKGLDEILPQGSEDLLSSSGPPPVSGRRLEKISSGIQNLELVVYPCDRFHLLIEISVVGEDKIKSDFIETESLKAQSSLQALYDQFTEEIARVLPFDQVILYRFDEYGHGQAVAEKLLGDFPSYKSMWFPKSDVPSNARAVMRARPVGVVSDYSSEPVALLQQDKNAQFDLTYSPLRSISRMCSLYYNNIGVHSGASCRILFGEELWGFIALWNYSPRGLSFAERSSLKLASDLFPLLHEDCSKKLVRSSLESLRKCAHDPVTAASPFSQLSSEIDSHRETLRELDVEAWFIASDHELYLSDTRLSLNFAKSMKEIIQKQEDEISCQREMPKELQEFEESRLFPGFAAMNLREFDNTWVVLLRKEIKNAISWAGEPIKPVEDTPEGNRLLPRTSFSLFLEEVEGLCGPWHQTDKMLMKELRKHLIKSLVSYSSGRIQAQSQAIKVAEENAQFGIWTWDVPTGVVHWDEKMFELYDLPVYDGEASYELWRSCVHPDDLPAAEAHITRCVEEGTPFDTEFRVVLRSGKSRYIKADAIREETPQGLRLVGSNRDITALREAEQYLIEAEGRFRSAFNTSPCGLAITALDGKIVSANPALTKLIGKSQDELLKANLNDFISQSDKVFRASEEEKLLKGKSAVSRNKLALLKAGEKATIVQADTALSYDSSGSAQHFITQFTDLSELLESQDREHRLEKDLLRIQRLETLGTFAGGIAHDFNNILAGLSGYFEVLELIDDKDKRLQICRKALSSCDHGKELIEKILSFSREERWSYELHSVSKICDDAIDIAKQWWPSEIDLEVVNELDRESDSLLCDQTQLFQVLLNLLSNALDAVKSSSDSTVNLEGKVQLRVSRCSNCSDRQLAKENFEGQRSVAYTGTSDYLTESAYVVIEVIDSGNGISESELRRIFEPFYTSKAPGEGTGLGLSMVFGIIQRHEGAIEVGSTEGLGTHFKIYLPIRKEK